MYRFEEIKNQPQLKQKLQAAMAVRVAIREWFVKNDFLEVETPTMVRAPGQEPYLNPFEVTVRDERGAETDGYLVTSPEYALKKLLVAGFSKIFELSRSFRNNEPTGGFHNPVFTMLEWYRAGTDYRGIMDDTEKLAQFVQQNLRDAKYPLQQSVDFSIPWERLTVREAFRKYADIDLDSVFEAPVFRKLLKKRGMLINGNETFDDCYFKVFLTKIEQKLGIGKPTFLYDYPASMAALARIKKDDPRYAERVEVYAAGVELANGYSELCDAKEQRTRFLAEQEIRKQDGKPVLLLDEEFLAALEEGLPECSGIALGVDRLAMVLLDAKSIREVLFFPWT